MKALKVLLAALTLVPGNLAAESPSSPSLEKLPADNSADLMRTSLKGRRGAENSREATSSKPARGLSPEQIDALIDTAAKMHGIDRSDPRLTELRNALNGRPSPDAAFPVPPRYKDEIKNVKVSAHYRSTMGIPLPAKDKIEIPKQLANEEHLRERIKGVMGAYLMSLTQKLKSPPPLSPLPQCDEDATKRYSTGYKGKDDDKAKFLDILFVDEDVPSDTSEIFGQQTMVIPYIQKNAPGVVYMARDYGVTCLPFRVRATKKFVMRDRGVNAVKNYDKDPHGKGVLHDYMKERLGLTKEAKKKEKARRAK